MEAVLKHLKRYGLMGKHPEKLQKGGEARSLGVTNSTTMAVKKLCGE